jgi:phosphoribosylglycinamide formyltransferase-1
MVDKIRVGALVSGGGTNLQAIIDACENGNLAAEIIFVGSDNPEARGLERAQTHGIDTFVVDYRALIRQYDRCPDELKLPPNFDEEDIAAKQSLLPPDTPPERLRRFIRTRVAAESRLLAEIEAREIDLLVLAGFMRTLTPYFIDRFNAGFQPPRIMNIHPALLPAFPGTDGYGDTVRYGCKVGGCTVHFIDYGEDSGPIIGQRAFPILPEDTLETVKKKGLKQEWELYPECIQMFAEGRLQVVKLIHELGGGRKYTRPVVRISK